jgi:hypothetical protein
LGLLALVMAPTRAAVPSGAIPGGTAGSGPAALQAFGAPNLSPAQRSSGAYAKLDGNLIELWQRSNEVPAATALDALHALNPAVRLRLHAPLALPEVLVDAVTRGDPQALRTALEGLGLEQAAVFANDVGGWLPVERIVAAGALDQLHALRASRPRTRSGAVTTQGDYAQRSDLLRASTPTGLSGTGIKVGVLSDSFNCFAYYQANGPSDYSQNGFTANYSKDVSSGDLPSTVQVLEEADCGNYGAPQQLPFTDEGRAILQIVHDVAPDASLAFYTAFTSEADFANGIVQLAGAGAKVIDDDVGYPDEPVFQDGILAQAVDQVEAQGVAYFSSAGNEGHNSYENAAPSFPGVPPSGAANAGEMLLNFDNSTGAGSTTTSLPLSIPALEPGEYLNLVVEWDQPYVTGAPDSGGSANALDLCYTDSAGTIVQCSGPNQVGGDPVVILTLGNPANASGNSAPMNIGVMIGLASGSPPKLVKFILEDDGAGSTINQFQTNSPTIQGHPGAAGAAAVGAAYYFQTPRCGTSPATLETFSSIGGDPILFDVSGNRLGTSQTRQKPQFVGPDGVDNTFLGTALSASQQPDTSISQCQDVAQYPSFFGTSAAAPHAAAVAALLLQAVPGVTPDEIYTALQSSAAPMGALNYDAGYGFIQADGALGQLPASCGSSSSSSSSSSGGCVTSSGGGGGGGGGGSIDPGLILALGLLGLLRASTGPDRRQRGA